jgi:hypothetical protein
MTLVIVIEALGVIMVGIDGSVVAVANHASPPRKG